MARENRCGSRCHSLARVDADEFHAVLRVFGHLDRLQNAEILAAAALALDAGALKRLDIRQRRPIQNRHLQARPGNPPSQTDEPEWMRLSTLVGAPAGAGVFRDLRAWHGATPNVGKEIRAMPNVEYGSSWLDDRFFSHCMPHSVWETLSDHAKSLCSKITTEPGIWPSGAGTMHPLARERAIANGNLGGSEFVTGVA